jgi:signal peptidase I
MQMAGRKRRVFSYEEQKKQRHRIRGIILWVIGFFFSYLVLTNLVFSIHSVQSNSMMPGVAPGDHCVFLSYGFYHLVPDLRIFAPSPSRGDIVIVDRDWSLRPSLVSGFVNTLFRFSTAGRTGFGGDGQRSFVKRVIGLPGDEISMTGFVLRVKSAGDPYTYTEFEQAQNKDRLYNVIIPENSALWDESTPFSGHLSVRTLGPNEFFVLSDDRGNTNDSRTWGPVPIREIAGKALFRYWPFSRIGRP